MVLSLIAVVVIGLLSQRGDDVNVVTRQLQPSAEDQRVEVGGGVTVVVPGGLLDTPTTLVATETMRLPNLAGGLLQSMPGHVIEFGDQTTFDSELTLEFVLDPARVEAGQKLLFVSYYDKENEQWVPVKTEIVDGVATVRTDHLSWWTSWFTTNDSATAIDPITGETYEVVYQRGGSGTVGGASIPIEQLAERIAQEASIAGLNYRASGYGSANTYMFLDDSLRTGEGYFDTKFGYTVLPTSFQDDTELADTVAHEAFHMIQAADPGIGLFKMNGSRWLVEAAAEYAAKRVASVPAKPLDTNAYKIDFRTGMRAVDDIHEYAMAGLVDRVLSDSGMSFEDFWTKLRSGSGSLDDRFAVIVRDALGYDLDEAYRRFLNEAITSGEPEVMSAPRVIQWSLSDDPPEQSEATGRLAVPAAGAMDAVVLGPPPSAINASASATIEFTPTSGTSDARVAVFVVPVGATGGIGTVSGGASPVVTAAGEAVTFALPAGSGVLITLFSSEAGVSMPFRLTAIPQAVAIEILPAGGGSPLAKIVDPSVAMPFVTGIDAGKTYELRVHLSPGIEVYEMRWTWPCAEPAPDLGRVNTKTSPEFAVQELILHCTVVGSPGLNVIGVSVIDVSASSTAPAVSAEVGFHLTAISPIAGATVGVPVTITAPDHRGQYRYRWNFGDGTTADTDVPTTTHTYTQATVGGPASVTLQLLPPGGSGSDVVLASFTTPGFEVTTDFSGTWTGTLTFTGCSQPPGRVPSCDFFMSQGVLTLHLVFRSAPDGTGEVDLSATKADGQTGETTTFSLTWTQTSVTWGEGAGTFNGTLDLAAGTMSGSGGGSIQDESLSWTWEAHRG
ncbi:MAG: PKD domain-containing protein [Ilumatobacteraceae bacterium]